MDLYDLKPSELN